jgi:Family of unknown function (DUF5317)
VALVFPVLAAVALGLVAGGRLGNLARIELRSPWLFFAAIGLQLVAFPLELFPWRTPEAVASGLWVLSYGLLLVAAVLNARLTGVPVIALGMLLNLVAILANGGTMPVRYEAMHEAGRTDVLQANSTALSDPSLPGLIDRWAAPDWIPFANVFSAGDVVIAVGAMVIVLAGMGIRVPGLPARSNASI